MSATISIMSSLSSCNNFRQRSHQPYVLHSISLKSYSSSHRHAFLSNRGFLRAKICAGETSKSDNKMDVKVQGTGGPAGPSPGNWKTWILGTLISIFLPFWKCTWTPIRNIKGQVETIVDTIDAVTEVVEKLAEGVEKVADEVAEHLPEGKLRDAACAVEHVAKHVAEDAHVADQFIHKIEEMGEETEEEIESIVNHEKHKKTKEDNMEMKEQENGEGKDVENITEPAVSTKEEKA